MKNKFIVIEGIDSSGKETQTRLLSDALLRSGSIVTAFSFPAYERSRIGENLKKCLSGEYGDFLKLSPYITSAHWSLDRAAFRDEMREALQKGIVVSDRYVGSNQAHQAAKLPPAERDDFISFIEEIEFETLKLPIPDIVFYLDVPPEITARLIKDRAKKDQHEKNRTYQKEVAIVYKTLVEKYAAWHAIPCMDGENIRKPEEIHRMIMDIL
ncbi:deoxynucleoside kinase [bacterium]|nr:deoxynucleoside kinase [bacterium]